jgi:hypothetical protein
MATMNRGALSATLDRPDFTWPAATESARPTASAWRRTSVPFASSQTSTALARAILTLPSRIAGFRFPPPRIEHRASRLVGEQFGRSLQVGDEPIVDRHQLKRSEADPMGERRAIDANPSVAICCDWRQGGRCHAYFETTPSATVASVGSPPSISCARAGAWMMPTVSPAPVFSQVRHAYLGRRVSVNRFIRPASPPMQ